MSNFPTPRLILLSAFLFLSGSAFSQLNIAGTIHEGKGTPFPYANVLLLNAQDSVMVKGMLTADNGTYQFQNIKPGNYLVAASMVGYQKTYSSIFSITNAQGTHQVKTLVLLE